MNDLDDKSKAFIKWVYDQLGTVDGYDEWVNRILANLIDYYTTQTTEQFMDKLEAKMIAGAKEHGEPKTNPDNIQHEINNEAIDLIGWSLMAEYAKQKND